MSPASPSSRPPRPASSAGAGSGSGRRTADGDAYSAGLWKLAGLGMTMSSEVIGGALLGWGLDYLFGTGPVLLLVFTLLGVGVGMAGFIRSALGASGDAGRDARSRVAAGRVAPLPPEEEETAEDEADPAEEALEREFEDAKADLRAELDGLRAGLRSPDAPRPPPSDETTDP